MKAVALMREISYYTQIATKRNNERGGYFYDLQLGGGSFLNSIAAYEFQLSAFTDDLKDNIFNEYDQKLYAQGLALEKEVHDFTANVTSQLAEFDAIAFRVSEVVSFQNFNARATLRRIIDKQMTLEEAIEQLRGELTQLEIYPRIQTVITKAITDLIILDLKLVLFEEAA